MKAKTQKLPYPKRLSMEPEQSPKRHKNSRRMGERANMISPNGKHSLTLSSFTFPKINQQNDEEEEIDRTITEYTPDPSLDDQFKEIGTQFARIKNYFSMGNDDAANSIDSSAVSDHQQNIYEDFVFEDEFNSFIDLLNKFFVDISNTFSNASKNDYNAKFNQQLPEENHSAAPDYLQKVLRTIFEQLQNALTIFKDLRSLQISISHKIVTSTLEPSLDSTSYQNFISLIEECSQEFIQNVLTMSKNLINDNNSNVYKKVLRAVLFVIFSQKTHMMYDLSKHSLPAINNILNEVEDEPEPQNQEELQEQIEKLQQIEEQQQLACKIYAIPISNVITDGYLNLSNSLKQMWQIELNLFKLAEKKQKPESTEQNQNESENQNGEGENQNNEGENDENLVIRYGIYDLFDNKLSPFLYPSIFISNRINFMRTLFDYQSQLEQQEEEDEVDLPQNPLIPIIKELNENCTNDLFDLIKYFWISSTQSKLEEYQKKYGQLLVDVIEARIAAEDSALNITSIAELIKKSISLQDNQTSSKLLRLFNQLMKDRLEKITTLQEDEFNFIARTIPERFTHLPEEPEVNELIQEANDIRNEIHDLVIQNTDSLMIFFDSFFLYRRIENEKQNEKDLNELQIEEDVNENPNENQNEEEKAELVFSVPEDEFRERITKYASSLKKFINEILENIISSLSTPPPSPQQDSSRSDAASTASFKSEFSRYSQLSKSEARKRAKSIICSIDYASKLKNSPDFILGKLQCQLAQQAIVRTYEELFMILQYVLVSSVRNLDAEKADQANKEIQDLYGQYQLNLETYKKLCLQSLDVNVTKSAESRLPEMKSSLRNYILKSLEESYKDLLIESIVKYEYRIQDIENIYIQEHQYLESDFYQMQIQLDEENDNEYKTIDKAYAVNCIKPNHNHNLAIQQKEKYIRYLLNQGQYDLANKEKRELQAMKNEENDRKKKMAHNTRKEMKKQQKEKIRKQQKELEDSNYLAQQRYYQKMVRDRDDQAKTLKAAIKATQQRMLLYASRLIVNDVNVKKELSGKFDKVTKETLKEYQLENIIETPRK